MVWSFSMIFMMTDSVFFFSFLFFDVNLDVLWQTLICVERPTKKKNGTSYQLSNKFVT